MKHACDILPVQLDTRFTQANVARHADAHQYIAPTHQVRPGRKRLDPEIAASGTSRDGGSTPKEPCRDGRCHLRLDGSHLFLLRIALR
jgi:hypothetical protein